MSIVEIKGGPITHRYLMNKRKDDLSSMVMRQLRDIETLGKAMIEAHSGYIPGSDGAPCDCPACRLARGYLT